MLDLNFAIALLCLVAIVAMSNNKDKIAEKALETMSKVVQLFKKDKTSR